MFSLTSCQIAINNKRRKINEYIFMFYAIHCCCSNSNGKSQLCTTSDFSISIIYLRSFWLTKKKNLQSLHSFYYFLATISAIFLISLLSISIGNSIFILIPPSLFCYISCSTSFLSIKVMRKQQTLYYMR